MKKSIFRPLRIGPVTSKNRIEVAPAAPFLAGHDGSVTPEFYEYTMSLARSGAGIVTIGVTSVDPRPPISARTLGLNSPLFKSDLSDVAEGIHSYGALASIELVHSRYMLSPPEDVVNGTSTEEVEEIIDMFANAAALAQECGFDMVMIHGGHGNVPSMFFNKKYNRRTDRFGGSFANRCRFGTELLQAVKKSTEGKVAIEYRISAEEVLPDMTTIEETLCYAKAIEPYIDMLHVSRGLLEEDSLLPVINAPVYLPKGMNLPYAKKFKEQLRVPVSVVGSFDLDIAERAVSDGDVDMVSMIRTILADTDCVEKARLGKDKDIRPCIRCNVCITRTHSQFKTVRCSVNPVIGREIRFDRGHKAAVAKKVVIVGGGPAGMEAARVCAERGHKVVLFEKEQRLGGNFCLACASELKKELRAYLDWSERAVLENSNIDLRLGTRGTREIVEAEHPDAVLIAVGSEPIMPTFSASGTDKIVWVGDAEKGGAGLGNEIIIAGAGVTGLELAASLSAEGKRLTLVDMLPEDKIGAGGTPINLTCLKQILAENGVKFKCGVRIEDVTQDGVIVSSGSKRETISCDTVVMSLGFRTNQKVIAEFDGAADSCWLIGDCSGRGGTVWGATSTAYERAMQI